MFWASRFARFTRSRRAIRSITFAPSLPRRAFGTCGLSRYGGSATIPLACGVPPLNINAEGIREAQYEI
jgi:hypothetical protein